MKVTVGGKTYYVEKFTPALVMEADRLLEQGTRAALGDEAAFLDEVVPFIANVLFSGQFTADDFLNRYESPTVVADILGMLGTVRGVIAGELAQFPREGKPEKNVPRGRKTPKP